MYAKSVARYERQPVDRSDHGNAVRHGQRGDCGCASYQRRRHERLERRGRELIGIALIVVALVFTLMLWSYSPEDPGWMVATEEPAKNFLGRFGAAVASTLIIIGGKGVWSIPVILAAWGARFTLHRGAEHPPHEERTLEDRAR